MQSAPTQHRATRWQLPSRTIEFPRRPLVMGIVNVTPDSFSDGGHFLSREAAVAHAIRLVEEGADLLDIGGESTRPYSDPVTTEDEIRRVLPVIDELAGVVKIPISIDTSKAAVAQPALAAGAEIINDVTGLSGDPRMISVALEMDAAVCVMHMQGTPQTMQDNPTYVDVVRDVRAYLQNRRNALIAAGIHGERICVDPGIGFGKTHEHNVELMRHCRELHDLDCPILVGYSRKGFLAKLIGSTEADRTNANVAAAISMAIQGVQIVRVHDVRAVREALAVFEATGGII